MVPPRCRRTEELLEQASKKAAVVILARALLKRITWIPTAPSDGPGLVLAGFFSDRYADRVAEVRFARNIAILSVMVFWVGMAVRSATGGLLPPGVWFLASVSSLFSGLSLWHAHRLRGEVYAGGCVIRDGLVAGLLAPEDAPVS